MRSSELLGGRTRKCEEYVPKSSRHQLGLRGKSLYAASVLFLSVIILTESSAKNSNFAGDTQSSRARRLVSRVMPSDSQIPVLADRYTNTAEPLAFVSVRSGERQLKSILPYPCTRMKLNSDGRLAVLCEDEEGTGFILVYKARKRLLRKSIGSGDNDILGWYHGKVVVRTGEDIRGLNVSTGELSPLDLPKDLVIAVSADSGDILIRETARGSIAEFTGRDGKKACWKRPLGTSFSNNLVISDRWVVVECAGSESSFTSLWIFDLKTSEDKVVNLHDWISGVAAGRSGAEVLIGLASESNFRVEGLDLRSTRRTTLATVNNRRTDLVGLSLDKRWAVLQSGYNEVGPGCLWALNLSTRKRVRMQENVYDCVLAP